MSPMNNGLLSLVAAVGLAVSGSAAAVPIQTALSVVIDGSGSISGSEFNTQKSAYSSVLGNASILPADDSVVINLIQFSTETQGIVEQSALRIGSEADRTTLVNAINGMTQIDGLTDIQEGINLGVTDMEAYLSGLAGGELAQDFRKLVDVSTDGGHNQGGDPAAETASAIGAGYTAVNCLGIGGGANCNFNNGPDGINNTADDYGEDFAATTFNDLEPVLTNKIGQELGTIPAPAPLALMGMGLVALGAGRLRKAR